MRKPATILLTGLCLTAMLALSGSSEAQVAATLRPPSAFADIPDAAARSRALMTEAGKVITHPRCMNCHPVADRPLQGDDRHPHVPPVVRGEAGLGLPGVPCSVCHQVKNVDLIAAPPGAAVKSIPGHPRWQLAPIEMAWEGKSLREICEQLKDPKRNGGRNLALLHEHMAHDDLIGWGWQPGTGRAPAPGTQELLGQLIQAWIDTGAHCP